MKGILLLISLLWASHSFSQNVYAEEPDVKIYQYVEKMPQFSTGDTAFYEFLANNIHYPDSLKNKSIEGTVYAKFVIEKDGSISNIEIIRSPHPLFSKEVGRVLKVMPNWIPGEQRGKKVRVSMVIPVNFISK